MPLVRSRYQGPDGLIGIEHKKDKTVFSHVQDISPIAEQCQELRKRGPKKGGSLRLYARIPDLVFFARKELTNPDGTVNKKELQKFLDSPDGELFKTVSGSAKHV